MQAIVIDWKDIPGDSKEKYQLYLCSREWGLKKYAVHERADNICERCGMDEIKNVHHLTYSRKYREDLDDLQGLCRQCHEFTHGISDYDPLAEFVAKDFVFVSDGHVQCPKCRGKFDFVHLVGAVVTQGKSIAIVTNEHIEQGEVTELGNRRGSAVCIQFSCECGHKFFWKLEFHKGKTVFDVHANEFCIDTNEELWRD